MRQVFSALLVLTAAYGWAEVKIANPGLADRETLKYTETVGAANRPFEATLVLAGEGASSRYEYRTVGTDMEALFRLDPATLLSLSSETLTKGPDATLRRTSEYRDLKIRAGPDDLVVTDLGSLPVVLRGFPWGQRTTAKITMLGNPGSGGGSPFSFELTVVGKEKVTAAGRTWECWKVTTGLGGAFALMMAKTELWFAVDGTHPLIKTSGPSGGPGSPMRTLVLQTYQTGK